MKVEEISIDKIEIVENIRVKQDEELKNLMESIKQHGLKEPIGVGKTKSGGYILIYGFRRLMAYKKLGFKTIPAVVDSEPEIAELLIVNTIENIQRRAITPSEMGRICFKLLEIGLTPGEMAAKIGISKGKILAALDVYRNIPEHLRDKIKFMAPGHPGKKGDIPASVAHSVLNLRRRYSFGNDLITELLEEVRKDELGNRDIALIGTLVKTGMSPKKAVEHRRDYMSTTLDLLLEKDLIEKLIKKHNLPLNEIFRNIISGKLKPIPLVSDTIRLLTHKQHGGDLFEKDEKNKKE